MLNQSINQSKKKKRCFKSNLSYTIQVVVIVSFSSSMFLVLVFLMFCLTVPHSFSVRYCQVPTWTWTWYNLCKVRVMWLGWPFEHKLSGQVPSPAGKGNQDLHKVLQQMKAWLALKPPGIRLLRWLTQMPPMLENATNTSRWHSTSLVTVTVVFLKISLMEALDALTPALVHSA